jgi:hypothetical protein
MQTFKYCDVLQRLENFDNWLISLGLRPRSNDRIHQAFNTLRMAEAASRKGRETGEYSKIQAEHLFPLIEALEAHDVFVAFEKESSEALANALKRALTGPTQPVDEKNEANRDGRNIWFELALAAEWRTRGATVRLGEPDLQLLRDNKTFLVACKRPASDNSVRSNIRGAISQLNDHLRLASQDVFGVVAISLSRVLNPGDKYWSGSLEELGSLLHQMMLHYRLYWRSADPHPRICAILFHAATPSDVGQKVDLSLTTYSVAERLRQDSVGTKIFEEHVRDIKARAEALASQSSSVE